MTLDAYLVAACAVVLTGLSKSGFAGGLGVLGVPLMALTMPPQMAVVVLLPILITIDALSVWQYRAAWQARTLLTLLPGAFLGIGLGMAGFAQVDADLLRSLIGAMALAFVAHHLWQSRRAGDIARKTSGLAVFLASMLSGFAGFVAHAGGPPIKGILLRMNLEKSAFVGTNAAYFGTLNVPKGIGYAALGLFSAESVAFSLALIPFLLVGVWLGFRLHGRIPQAVFVRLAYAVLALAGGTLLFLGLFAG